MSQITEATLFRLSKEKLLDAGYTFLRLDDFGESGNCWIRYCSGSSRDTIAWKVLETFPTKAARDRRAKELIESGKYLMD
ncbi:MAG: hypothetical protein J6S84_09065 [Bacteroidales bacterium]|nr:hypothetical protein [Bacteroidales bacterium]